jgi:hypothetical protein
VHKIAKTSMVAAAALTAAVGLTVSPASASATATWTVTPGGAFTATASSPTLTDTSTGTQLKCTSSAAAGSLVTSSSDGVGLASISSVTWSSCTGPIGITFAVTAQGLPWKVNAVSYNSSTGTTTGTLTGVKAHISGSGCTADFGGATSGSTATLNATYVNSTKTLTISGGNLHAYNVSGLCLGLMNNGDAATYSAKYVLASAQTISSP